MCAYVCVETTCICIFSTHPYTLVYMTFWEGCMHLWACSICKCNNFKKCMYLSIRSCWHVLIWTMQTQMQIYREGWGSCGQLTGGAHGGTWAHMEWFVSHTTLSCSGQVSRILLMFVFDLWRTLEIWSSHHPSHHCSVGWGLHTEMNTKHKQLCLCQRFNQGSGNKNDDFWQIWAGTCKEGERSAFPDVFLSLSPS